MGLQLPTPVTNSTGVDSASDLVVHVATKICIQKAGCLARRSPEAIAKSREWMIVTTLGFAILALILAWKSIPHPTSDSVRSLKERIRKLCRATIYFTAVSISFATFVLAIQYETYCEQANKLGTAERDWLLCGFLLAPAALLTLADRTHCVTDVILGTCSRCRQPRNP